MRHLFTLFACMIVTMLSAQVFESVVIDYKPTINVPDYRKYKHIRTSERSESKNILKLTVPEGENHDVGIYYLAGDKPGVGRLVSRGRVTREVGIPTKIGSYVICSLVEGQKYLKIVMLRVFEDRIQIYQIDTLERPLDVPKDIKKGN